MDEAKENYAIGRQRIVTAKKAKEIYLRTVPSNARRFICLECGEYVTFVRRNKHKSFFRHSNSNEDTKFCELRSQGQECSSIYERVGLPLYLKRCNNNKFELYLGFYSLDETLINISQKEKFKISIKSLTDDNKISTTYLVDANNFSISETTLKRIDFLSEKYKIEYSLPNAENLLKGRWGNNIEGILRGRALFTYDENGGRKIRINDEITTDTEYFFLCENENVLERYEGIKYERCGEILLKSSFISFVYNVYKISFKAFNDEQFNKLHNFCRDTFKASLIYKPYILTPMWPPAIYKDNQISFLNQENEALFVLRSDEINESIFIHRGSSIDELTGEKIEGNKYLMKLPVTVNRSAVNINEKYNSILIFLTRYKRSIKTYSNNFYIQDNDNNPINRGRYDALPAKKIIRITAKSKCDIIHFKKNLMYKEYRIKNEKGIILDNIAFGDVVLAISGIECIFLLEYIKNHTHTGCDIDDELLYLRLCKLGEPFITPPVWVKKIIGLLRNDSKIYRLVKNYLVTNKIPVNSKKILRDVYKIMKVGANCGET